MTARTPILIIDSSDAARARLLLVFPDRIERALAPYAKGERRNLLKDIHDLLGANGLAIREVGGIAAVRGPGAFSFLRTGIAIANALGYALDLPVAGVPFSQSDEDLLEDARKALSKASGPIAPEYGKDPNITPPRRADE